MLGLEGRRQEREVVCLPFWKKCTKTWLAQLLHLVLNPPACCRSDLRQVLGKGPGTLPPCWAAPPPTLCCFPF